MDQLAVRLSSIVDNAIINIAAGVLVSAIVWIWRAITARHRRNS